MAGEIRHECRRGAAGAGDQRSSLESRATRGAASLRRLRRLRRACAHGADVLAAERGRRLQPQREQRSPRRRRVHWRWRRWWRRSAAAAVVAVAVAAVSPADIQLSCGREIGRGGAPAALRSSPATALGRCPTSRWCVLQIVSSPLDEMALVAAPATGAVAVVDATARAILEGLGSGRDEHALAAACAEASGVTVADALGEVVALRRAWVGLATARRPTRSPALPARSSRQPSLDTVCRVGSAPVRLRIWPPRLAALLAAVTAHCRYEDAGVHGPDGISTLEAWRVGGRYLLFQDHRHLLTTDSLMLARSELLRRLVLASHPERAWLAILHGAGGRRAERRRPPMRHQRCRQEHADGLPARLRAGPRDRRLRAARGRQPTPLAGPVRAQRQGRQLAPARTPLPRPRDDACRAHPAAPPALCPAAPDSDRAAARALPRLPALPARGRRRADRAAAGRGAGALRAQRRLVRELAASGWASSPAGSPARPPTR